jgi:hypothetical protein
LTGRLDRVGLAVDSIVDFLTRPGAWHFFAPAFIVIVFIGIGKSRTRLLAGTYAGIVITSFVVLVGVYWVSSPPIQWYLDTSANRTVDPLIFLAALAIAHLMAFDLPRASSDSSRTPPSP